MQQSIGAFRLVFVCALLGLALASAGCMQSELGDPNPYYSVTQEKDIPAPRDFQFDKDRSYTYTLYRDPKGIGSFRNTTLYYYGDQHVGKLLPWYHEQMKADGWIYRENRDDQDKRCLVFTKSNETAFIQIYREFDPRRDRYMTFVKAEIHPTRTEEMASEELLNAPLLPQGTDGKAGVDSSPDGAIPADDEISPRPAAAEESSIIMNSRRGDQGARIAGTASTASQPPAPPARAVASRPPASKASPARTPPSSKIVPEEDKAVVNEEMGTDNSEESAGELPAEDEDSEK